MRYDLSLLAGNAHTNAPVVKCCVTIRDRTTANVAAGTIEAANDPTDFHAFRTIDRDMRSNRAAGL